VIGIPADICYSLEQSLDAKALRFTRAQGGSINNTGCVQTSKGNFFLKWNELLKYPGMLKTEALGLQTLRESNTFRIPDVVVEDCTNVYQYLLLEYIESKPKASGYWANFGILLQKMHRFHSDSFGLDYNNYIGSLQQRNKLHRNWSEFFIEERLKPQLKIAVNNNLVKPKSISKFELLFEKLPGILVQEPPSLLHGDLWSGNVLCDEKGKPCLIDPSVYYGNREMDLAMTQLFGGFDEEFLDVYQAQFPLEKGFESRFLIYKLYPLMVHLNLFGRSYWPQVVSIINRYV
jgi:protein-ribulosamine 3-kinase